MKTKKIYQENGKMKFDYSVVYPCTEIPELTSPVLGLDIETAPRCDHPKAGLDPWMTTISLIQIYDPKVKTVYVFDVLEDKALLKALLPLLASHTFVGHNSKFELTHLMKAGAVFPKSMHCTMLASQLIGAAVEDVYEPDEDELDTPVGERDGISAYKRTSHSLENCCIRWLNIGLDKSFQTSNWTTRPLSENQVHYAAFDAVATYELFRLFIQVLKKYSMLEIYTLQREALLPIVDMETNGIAVDWAAHDALIQTWKHSFEIADAEARKYFGLVNLASNKQMGEWLTKVLPQHLDTWPKTAKGAFSFTATSLADFRHVPQIEALFKWKKYKKLLTTYGQEFQDKHRHPITQRVHTGFTLGETATGRLSSRSPNLQNQPRDGALRSIFVAPRDKVLVVADFSQIELRVQAELSKDPIMLQAYKDKSDIYKVMASSLYNKPVSEIDDEQRTLGKVAMLSLGYGTGARKLRSTARAVYDLEINEDMAYQTHRTYHDTFSVYSTWCNDVRYIGEIDGTARTVTGKLRKLDPQKIYTTAPNHIVQGTATELLLMSLIKARKAGLKLILNIHDEIIIECPKDPEVVKQSIELLEEAMNTSMKELFPDTVDAHVADAFSGINWAKAKGAAKNRLTFDKQLLEW